MFKVIFLLFVFTYVNCESDPNELVTTIRPIYSANQLDDEVNSIIENKIVEKQPVVNSPIIVTDEIPSIEIKNVEIPEVKELKQNHLNLSPNSEVTNLENVESVTVLPINSHEITTIEPSVNRVKRAPRYTVRELMYPNGIMHEVGHVRDHAVERFAKALAKRRIPILSSRAAIIAVESKAKTDYHHKYHHIPNHLAYLPVIGPLLDENKPRDTSRRQVIYPYYYISGTPTRLVRVGRIRRGGRRRIRF